LSSRLHLAARIGRGGSSESGVREGLSAHPRPAGSRHPAPARPDSRRPSARRHQPGTAECVAGRPDPERSEVRGPWDASSTGRRAPRPLARSSNAPRSGPAWCRLWSATSGCRPPGGSRSTATAGRGRTRRGSLSAPRSRTPTRLLAGRAPCPWGSRLTLRSDRRRRFVQRVVVELRGAVRAGWLAVDAPYRRRDGRS